MNGLYFTKYNNCSHDLNKYIDGIFVKDDYCDSCVDQINEIDAEYKESTQ